MKSTSPSFRATASQPRKQGSTIALMALCLVGAIVVAGLAGVATFALSKALSPTRTARASDLARLVGRPMRVQGVPFQQPNQAMAQAMLSANLYQATELGQADGEMAAVAREYADVLKSLQTIAKEPPSFQPLVRGGLDAWRGSLENNDSALFLGLIGALSELSNLAELAHKLDSIHTRLIACRIRVMDIAAKNVPQVTPGETITAAFSQAGGLSTVKNDTLSITNVSGVRLTNAMVLVELVGSGGDQFHNLFFAEAWEPNQTLLAECSSGPFRETVHHVVKVRFRVIADQRTSAVLEVAGGS